ncbi:MAG: DUF262 domain-containing protein, partial [Actinomycetota bacterium]
MGVGTEELIKQVKKLLGGELQIPSIQRGYVWKRTQIPRLLDSLYRDYPVGSLLIWDTDLDFPVKTAAVIQSTPQYGKPGVLLDGQQRLTSLAWVYRPEAAGPGIRVPDVRFDIRVEEFLLPSAVQRRDPFLIPVGSVLADDAQFASLLKPLGIGFDHPNYEEFYERLNRLRSVRDYQMPVQSVSSNDYETVA